MCLSINIFIDSADILLLHAKRTDFCKEEEFRRKQSLKKEYYTLDNSIRYVSFFK